jgi:hypothetical protein
MVMITSEDDDDSGSLLDRLLKAACVLAFAACLSLAAMAVLAGPLVQLGTR